jgi:N-acetylglucosamine-6-sulfatase
MHRNSTVIQQFAVLTLCLFAAINGSTQSAFAADARPNIVFILVDDLRWDALGFMGHPFVKTPHVDRLAAEGCYFRNFFVTLPLCSPARSSFLTGQYAHTTGVINNRDHSELSHKLVTFPRLLHDAGYETAYVGKWHMGTDDSPRPGFDRWVSFKGQGVFENPPINFDGKSSKVEGYMTDILNGHAVDFIRKERSKPFALYLSHKAVHGPFTPAERHKDLYADAKYTAPPNVKDTMEGKPALMRPVEPPPNAKNKKKAKTPAVTGQAHEKTMLQQMRCVGAIDDGVGLILKALEETKRLDDTMIVFTSDNGYFWGEHSLGDKRAAYEESIRIPFVVRYPKLVKAGSRIEQLALNIDVAPTFLELAGVAVPKQVQGKSLLPLFKGDASGWRTSFLAEYFMEQQFGRVPTWQAVRTERWKYIRYTELEGMDELYDLQADPYEMKNLIGEQSARDAAAAMKKELDRLVMETGAKQ